jgi:hypothetical protein
VNVGSSLYGDIIIDADQIQWAGQDGIVRALKVVANSSTELAQHECQERRAAIHKTQREEHNVLQPSNAPDSQMHFAPLGVNAGAYIVRVNATSRKELYHHYPEYERERRDEAQQIQERPDNDELSEVGSGEKCSDFEGIHGDEQGH